MIVGTASVESAFHTGISSNISLFSVCVRNEYLLCQNIHIEIVLFFLHLRQKYARIFPMRIFLLLTGLFLFLMCYLQKDYRAREGNLPLSICTGLFLLSSIFWSLIQKACAFLLLRILFVLIGLAAALYLSFILFLFFYSFFHSMKGDESAVMLLGCDLMNGKPGLLYQTRLETAKRYLASHPDQQLLASGGTVKDPENAESLVAKRILSDAGISPDRILTESSSTTTLENFRFSVPILEDSFAWDKTKPVVIITNRFHCFRAIQLAKSEGYRDIRLLAAPCPFRDAGWFFREVMVVVKFFFVGPF